MLVKQSEKSSLFSIFLRNIFYIENIHLLPILVCSHPLTITYFYMSTDMKKMIWCKEKHLQECRASETTGENMRKNPIYKHEILKSVHIIARRGLSGHSINMTAMIQRKKNRYLVLKVWQQLAGFESSLNLAAASSVLPVRKTFTDLHRVIILLPLL